MRLNESFKINDIITIDLQEKSVKLIQLGEFINKLSFGTITNSLLGIIDTY